MPQEILVKSALHKLKNKRLPYQYDLNPYRGCSFNCQYCYAMYSHQYLNSNNFFNDIYIKTNIPEILEQELRQKKIKNQIINIGGVTDAYQPIEKKYALMPKILKLMIKYKVPIIISTKSDLILRDLKLIHELSQLTYVNIAVTVTSLDEIIRKKIEKNAANSLTRLEVLKNFKKTSASIGLHVMPILPFITDSEKNIEKIFHLAKQIKVNYVLSGGLNLRGPTKKHFLKFITENFPEKYENYQKLYSSLTLKKQYSLKLKTRINKLKNKYEISDNYSKVIYNKLSNQQLKLF